MGEISRPSWRVWGSGAGLSSPQNVGGLALHGQTKNGRIVEAFDLAGSVLQAGAGPARASSSEASTAVMH